jgi:hypothetical protein
MRKVVCRMARTETGSRELPRPPATADRVNHKYPDCGERKEIWNNQILKPLMVVGNHLLALPSILSSSP